MAHRDLLHLRHASKASGRLQQQQQQQQYLLDQDDIVDLTRRRHNGSNQINNGDSTTTKTQEPAAGERNGSEMVQKDLLGTDNDEAKATGSSEGKRLLFTKR